MLTNQQKYDAFMKATDNIEGNPDDYDFLNCEVNYDCPVCVWGHVGRVLGVDEGEHIEHVARSLGVTTVERYEYADNVGETESLGLPSLAVKVMRSFANDHFKQQGLPQEILDIFIPNKVAV